jgi:hypothetical protein
MKILVTGPGEFSGDTLKVGKYYNAELADELTERQRKTFEALVQCYWVSGCHSYNDARSYPHFRELMKLYLGAGTEKCQTLVNEDGTPCPGGRITYRLKSRNDYTKKEMQLTIDNIINEMFLVGVNTPRFNEIIKGMEEKQAEREAEKINNPDEQEKEINNGNCNN